MPTSHVRVRGLVLFLVVIGVLGGQYWLRSTGVSPSTRQSSTPTDDSFHPPAEPIYTEGDAIARAVAILPWQCALTGTVARLTSRSNAKRWLQGPNADSLATYDADIGGDPAPNEADGVPTWVVGVKCQSITVGEAMDVLGVDDDRSAEGIFYFFEAGSGADTTRGALDTQTWTTFESLIGMQNESIAIMPMTPVIVVAGEAQPTETYSQEDLATIGALDTASASTATP